MAPQAMDLVSKGSGLYGVASAEAGSMEGSRKYLGKGLQEHGPSRELSAPSPCSSHSLVHPSPGTNVTGLHGGLREHPHLTI